MDSTSQANNCGEIKMELSPDENTGCIMNPDLHQSFDIRDVIKTEPLFELELDNENTFEFDKCLQSPIYASSAKVEEPMSILNSGLDNKMHSLFKVDGYDDEMKSENQKEDNDIGANDQHHNDNILDGIGHSQLQPCDIIDFKFKAEPYVQQIDDACNGNKTIFQSEQDNFVSIQFGPHMQDNQEMDKDFDTNNVNTKTESKVQKEKEMQIDASASQSAKEQIMSTSLELSNESKSGTKNSVKCMMCKNSFYDNSSLRRHILRIHQKGGDGVTCNICNKNVYGRGNLTKHILEVHQEVKNCSDGIKSVQDQGTVKAFPCSTCNKSYSQLKTLRKHERTHTDPFLCVECQQPFSSKQHLKLHVDGVHKKLRPFSCPECEKPFLTKTDVDRHVKSVHKKLASVRHKCAHCDKTYSGKRDLERHVDVVHRQLRLVSCTECKDSFFSKRDLNRHLQEVHKILTTFKCPECERTYSRKEDFVSHMVVIHKNLSFNEMTENVKSEHGENVKDDVGPGAPQQFEMLDFELKSESPHHSDDNELNMDIKSEKIDASYSQAYSEIEEETKPDPSQIWNTNEFKIKTEPSWQEGEDADLKIGLISYEDESENGTVKVEKSELGLDLEFESQSPEMPTISEAGKQIENSVKEEKAKEQPAPRPTCDICNKSFFDRRNLRKHKLAVHEKVKNWTCQICGQAFFRKKNCDRHIDIIHNKLTPYSCPTCHKSFARSELLKIHELSHGNGHPFQCELCPSFFTTKHHLERHVRGVHEKLRPWSCSHVNCDKSFLSKRDLDRHFDAVHRKIKPHKCEESGCERSFAGRADLVRHIDVVHRNLKPHSCTMCEKSFAKMADRDQHINSVHLNLKSFTCAICQKAFRSKKTLQKHEKMHLKETSESLIEEYPRGKTSFARLIN